MSERIEAYLAELDRRLSRRVPEKRRSELIAELRSHLHLRAKDAGEDAAQTLEALGPLDLVAEDLIRSESGVDTKSVWRLAALPLGLLVVLVLTPHVAPFIFSNNPSLLRFYNAQEPLGYAMVLGFMWAVWRSKRWLVAPVAIVLVAGVAYSVARHATQLNVPRKAELIARQVLAGDLEAAKIRYGEFGNSGVSGYLAPCVGGEAMTPLPYAFGASIPWKGDSSLRMASANEAERLWKADGEAFLESIDNRVMFHRQNRLRGFLLGWQIGVFTLLNALLLRLDARRRRLIHRKSRLA